MSVLDVQTDAVLFVPELVIGLDALDPSDTVRLRAHLAATAASRSGVLHTNVAWNSLYFGWDPVSGTYGAIDDYLCGPLQHGGSAEAVPVGALCWVGVGAGLLWGEVIYKEGASVDIDDLGDAPAALSGAPAEISHLDGRTVAVVRERLVVDFEAFDLDDRLSTRLDRFVRNGRYLDKSGHLVVDAVYTPPERSSDDDITFYAHWLWATHRHRLRSGWLGACLTDPADDEALWAALVGSLRCVDALLDTVPELSAWGSYRYVESAYRDRLADPDLPLGAGDAHALTSSLATPPRSARVAYRALRHRLVDLCGEGEADLRFAAYPAAVCHANRMVADTLADAAPDGILARVGAKVHLRLDDSWQAGGLWRAELLNETTTCALLAIDATLPLALGATGEAADVHIANPEAESAERPSDPATEPGDDRGDPDDLAPRQAEPDVSASHVHWNVALRRGQHRDGYLLVPDTAGLRDGEIVVRLAHDGDIADNELVQHARVGGNGRYIEGLAWPFDFFPGIRLWCICVPGGKVVHAATSALSEPVTIDGNDYWFAVDPSVLDSNRPSPPAETTVADLAIRALRRHGEAGPDGRLALDAAGLSRCLFGPDAAPEVQAALDSALAEASLAGRVSDLGDGRYAVQPARHGRARPDTGLFDGADQPTARGREHLWSSVRRVHWVVLHLRRLPVADRATPERQAQYRRLRQDAPNKHLLPADLPHGYTFVEEHRRGR